MLKRLCLFLFVLPAVIAFPLAVYPSGFIDVTKDLREYHDIIKIQQLGLIDKNLAAFRPEDDLTRLELAEIIAKILGFHQSNDLESTVYEDVQSNSSEAYYVNIATQTKIMRGYSGKTFRPYDGVTYREFIESIVRLLGYEPLVESRKDKSYTTFAHDIGIARNLNFTPADFVKRDTAANVISKALETEILIPGYDEQNSHTTVKGKTLLTEIMGIHTYEGRVLSAQSVSLVPELQSKMDEAVVGDVLFRGATGAIKNMLGEKVKVYYREDGAFSDKSIVYCTVLTNPDNIVHVNGKDIVSFRSNILSYQSKENSERAKQMKISPQADVVFNSRPIYNLSESDFRRENGDVKLVDYDSDGLFETVIIKSYTTMIVGSVNTVLNRITDKYTDSLYIDIPDNAEDVSVFENNIQIDFKGIAEGNVLSVYQSRDSEHIEIYIENTVIQGVITQYDSDYIDINGFSYRISEYFLNTNRPVFLGEPVAASLDREANLVALNYSGSDWKYGYALELYQQKGLNFDVKLKLVNQESAIVVLNAAQSITVDGAQARQRDIFPTLLEAFGSFSYNNQSYIIRQPVRYKINEEGFVSLLDTRADGMDANDEERLRLYHSGTHNYRGRAYTFHDADGIGKFTINSGSIIFKGITGENEPQIRFGIDEKFYGVVDFSTLGDFTNREIQSYNLDDGGLAKVVVMYSAAEPDLTTLSGTSLFGMVDRMSQAINEDGEPVYKIHMYVNGVLSGYTFDHDYMAYKDIDDKIPFERGDIIRFNESDKSISVLALVYDCGKDKMYQMNGGASTLLYSGRVSGGTAIYFGQAYSMRARNIRISVKRDEEGNYLFDESSLAAFDTLSAPVIMYNGQNNKIFRSSFSDIVTYKQSDAAVSHVFIALRSGTVYNVFIYNR